MPLVNFKNEGISIDVPPGTTILEATRHAGVLIKPHAKSVGKMLGAARGTVNGVDIVELAANPAFDRSFMESMRF